MSMVALYSLAGIKHVMVLGTSTSDTSVVFVATELGQAMTLLTIILVWATNIISEVYTSRRSADVDTSTGVFLMCGLGLFLAGDVVTLAIFFECMNVPLLVMLTSRTGVGSATGAGWFPNKGLGQAVLLLISYGGLSGLLLAYGLMGGFLGECVTVLPGNYAMATTGPGIYAEGTTGYGWAICLGGAVKVALVPVHAWLCKVHVECSTVGSALLAGVAMKSGYYLHLLFLGVTEGCCNAWLTIGLVVGGALVCVTTIWQVDAKRWIAMYSVGHVQCLYVIWLLGGPGHRDVTAAILAGMIGHSLISAGMFLTWGAACDAKLNRVQATLRNVGTSDLRGVMFVLVLCNGAYPGSVLFMTEVVGLGGLGLRSNMLATLCISLSAVNMISGLIGVGRMITVVGTRPSWEQGGLVMVVTPLMLISALLGLNLLLPVESFALYV